MAIGRLNHGAEYLWLWMNLAFEYANYAGVLCKKVGDDVLPISADELAREMKGGFTEAAIRDGIKVLIEGKLIYINSNGFMAITGLVISGDPAEPRLHVHNSNREDFRPISIGTDTKEAAYKREYRARLKMKEEQPQLMKKDFKSRPVHVSREDRIKAHFLICYLALLVYRVLEKKLNEKYTTCEILSTLRAMKLLAVEGIGYQPAYTRTDITDDLHEAFGFYTDYEIMKKNKIREIIHQTKQKQV